MLDQVHLHSAELWCYNWAVFLVAFGQLRYETLSFKARASGIEVKVCHVVDTSSLDCCMIRDLFISREVTCIKQE